MKEKYNKKKALAYYLDLTSEGRTLSVRWNGGYDVPQAHLFLDEEPVPGDHHQSFTNFIFQNLGYDTSGDGYHPTGDMKFDRVNHRFSGRDCYSVEQEQTACLYFEGEIPADLWFDDLHIVIRTLYDDRPIIDATFSIRNGPLHEKYWREEDKLEALLAIEVIDFLERIDGDILGMHEEIVLERQKFKKVGDMLVFNISALTYSYEKELYREIMIDMNTE